MTIIQQLEKDLVTAFDKLNFDKALAIIGPSGREGADYQCNACFSLAKSLGKKPLDLAEAIAKIFKSKLATIEVSPPGFLNLILTDEALVKMGNGVLKSKALPLAPQEKRTVFFDYGGANVAKELHIGHLRSPIIGEALRRVFSAFGHKTISDVYLGDWGLQMGLVIAELEREEAEGRKHEITLDLLNVIYPRASKRKDTDATFRARAEDITKRLQDLEEPFFGIWKKMRKVSVDKIKENYEVLNCKFDYYNGESDAQKYVDIVLEHLKKLKLAYVHNGSLIMDIAEEGEHVPIPKKSPDEPQRFERPMPPILLQKGNGGDLYATSDVATIWYRHKNHKPDEFIYIVDVRQDLHFRQVFRTVKKGQIVPETTKFVHVGYGTMNGADGRPFKTRAGGTIKLEEVFTMISEAAKRKLIESGRTSDEETARKIGLAALKFADLSNSVRRDYVFDLDKFTSFEGKTGPYLLYTVARINSILEKAENMQTGTEILFPPNKLVGRDIFISVLRLADSFAGAMANYTLNGIVDSVYQLAQVFNNFYATTRILGEEDKQLREYYLSLCQLTKIAIEFALDKLGIDTVEKM